MIVNYYLLINPTQTWQSSVTTVTNQNCIHEEVKSRFYSENVSFRSVNKVLSSRVPYKNLNLQNYNFEVKGKGKVVPVNTTP
jgi:hypothetical protein